MTWSRRQKPHHSELTTSNYIGLLSHEEGVRRGESVSQLATDILIALKYPKKRRK